MSVISRASVLLQYKYYKVVQGHMLLVHQRTRDLSAITGFLGFIALCM